MEGFETIKNHSKKLMRELNIMAQFGGEPTEFDSLIDILKCFKIPLKTLRNLKLKFDKNYEELQKLANKRRMEYLMYLYENSDLKVNGRCFYYKFFRVQFANQLNDIILFILETCNFVLSRGTYLLPKISFLYYNYPIIKKLVNNEELNEVLTSNRMKMIKNIWGGPDIVIKPRRIYPQISDQSYELKQIIDIQLVEWSITKEYIGISVVSTLDRGLLTIPDSRIQLSQELQPFDLTLCALKPSYISDKLQILKPLKRLNINEALDYVKKGIPIISQHRPFNILKNIIEAKINPENIDNELKKYLGYQFIWGFNDVVNSIEIEKLKLIETNKSRLFYELKKDPNNLDMNLLKSIINIDVFLDILKDFNIDQTIINIISECETHIQLVSRLWEELEKILKIKIAKHQTSQINVRALFDSQLNYLIPEIIQTRINELKSVKIIKHTKNKFDISKFRKTYYGSKILNTMFVRTRKYVNTEELNRFTLLLKELNIFPEIVNLKK